MNGSGKIENRWIGFVIRNPVVTFLRRNRGVLVTLLLMVALVAYIAPTFFTGKNAMNVMRQLSTNMLLTMALTLCIIMGSIDLSVAATIATSGIVMLALYVHFSLPLYISIIAALVFGMVFGLLNGIIIAYTGLPPFLVTLSTTNIIRGIGFVYTNGTTIVANDDAIWWIGKKYLFGWLPFSLVMTVVCGILVWFFLYKTRTGIHVYAVGSNEEAACNAGINVRRVRIIVHVIAGVLAAVAGILLTCRMESATARAGVAYEADAISSVVLGGISFKGGRGFFGGAMIGALVIAVIGNGMNSIGLSDNWQFVVKGLVVIIAVFLDTISERLRKRSQFEANRTSARIGGPQNG